ncbi:MAG: flagellar biosynthesis protein FlhA, partial [Candidatus Omnitrophota bacterium]
GGSYVVGLVIFIILIVIQYVVVTSGSQRIAEVAARFTLDAMPGKQMAIDADLNSGLINEDQARARRVQIQKEADFYGAMDGASKFVRGDATAAIIVILVNIIGGFIIGMVQQHMQFIRALQVYTLLTIGAGIAMQVSSLLLSTATGLIVSRAATDTDLGQDLSTQIFRQPRAIGIAAALLLSFVFVPAIPKIPFLLIAGSVGGIALTLRKASQRNEEEVKKNQQREALLKKKPESVFGMLKMDVLELEVGYGLIPLVNPEQGGSLLDRVTLIRRQLALDLGIIVPPIRIRDNVGLAPNEYVIKIKGVESIRRQVYLNHYLAINPGRVSEAIDGIQTQEPVFNLPATWITELQKKRAELLGYTVVDVPSIIATHLSEIIRTQAACIITRQDVQGLVDNVKKEFPAVVDELIPNLLTIGEVQKVLQGLLSERVSIRDLVTILETLADNAKTTKDLDSLVGFVRIALSRQICRHLQADDKSISVVTIDPQVEAIITEALRQQDQRQAILALEPDVIKKIFASLSAQLEKIVRLSKQPVVLASPNIRAAFRKLTERNFPNVHVLSYNEVSTEQEIKSLGMVSL